MWTRAFCRIVVVHCGFEMAADEKNAEKAQVRPGGVIALAPHLIPGISLSLLIALAAYGIQLLQLHYFEHPYLEALVIAILLGTAVRTAWMPGPRWQAGIAFCAKQVLEVAVTLLGASISFALLAASGLALLSAIVATVAVMLAATYAIARLLGLPVRLSILIACGNSVCGNSAIAAAAPIIGAKGDEIASSISFTAILGVLVVLGLPLLIPLLEHLADTIRDRRRADGLCGAAGSRRDCPGRTGQLANRHAGQARSRAHAWTHPARACRVRTQVARPCRRSGGARACAPSPGRAVVCRRDSCCWR